MENDYVNNYKVEQKIEQIIKYETGYIDGIVEYNKHRGRPFLTINSPIMSGKHESFFREGICLNTLNIGIIMKELEELKNYLESLELADNISKE